MNTSNHYIYLNPEDYLPALGNALKSEAIWSVALNVLIEFQFSVKQSNKLVLFLGYEDQRGKHKFPVEFIQPDEIDEYLFSDLLLFPVRGSLSEVHLILSGVSEDAEVETGLFSAKVEESRSFIQNRSIKMVS